MYKVALIHPDAGVNWETNSSVFAVELARRLDNYFEVQLLSGTECGSFSQPIKSITRSEVAKLCRHPLVMPMLPKSRLNLEAAIEYVTSFVPCIVHLLNNPVDLVLPQNGYGGLLVASCLRAIKGTPILFTEHNSIFDQKRGVCRNLNLQPERIVACNPATADYIRQLAPEQMIEIIPFGIDLAEFSSEGDALLLGLMRPCVLCVAPLVRDGNQRVELTIRAVAQLPKASLLLCGDGIDREYFQNLGDRLLGTDRFQIKKFAYASMPQVYRSASVFTSAAAQESHGLKYIEAMACGLPIVAQDDQARRYLVGESGVLCDVTKVELYAESLQEALERNWYKNQPRQNALRFSWQGITLLYYQAIMKTIIQSDLRLIGNKSRP